MAITEGLNLRAARSDAKWPLGDAWPSLQRFPADDSPAVIDLPLRTHTEGPGRHGMDSTELAGLNPFGIFDVEAGRLDLFFSGLDEAGWDRPSRCPGWTVRDVLSHLAGEELYNHACLSGDIETFRSMVRAAGITGGYDELNNWCVRQRRGLPVGEVLAEWREGSGGARHR